MIQSVFPKLNRALRAAGAAFKYDKISHYFITGCSGGVHSSAAATAPDDGGGSASLDLEAGGSIQTRFLTSSVLTLHVYFRTRLGMSSRYLSLAPCFRPSSLPVMASAISPILATIQLQEIFTQLVEEEDKLKVGISFSVDQAPPPNI